jgi:hypothetical protein
MDPGKISRTALAGLAAHLRRPADAKPLCRMDSWAEFVQPRPRISAHAITWTSAPKFLLRVKPLLLENIAAWRLQGDVPPGRALRVESDRAGGDGITDRPVASFFLNLPRTS